MAYRVDTRLVAAEVAQFSDRTFTAWEACLKEIVSDPYPRLGYYVDQAVAIRGVTMRTWLYEITADTSISGDRLLVFTAEFFPEYAPVYTVNEDAQEIVMIYLRENRRA